MNRSHTILLAALLAGSGVALGAMGAHALADAFEQPNGLASWETGVRYQVWHALALFALASATPQPGRVTPLAFAIGSVLFCGSLYALALGGSGALFGPITPIGGTLLLVGWLALAWRAWRGDFAIGAPVDQVGGTKHGAVVRGERAAEHTQGGGA